MLLPTVIFVAFTLLSVAGVYLVARPKSLGLAVGLSVLTLVFFVGLALGLLALLRSAPPV